jgi:hypothetical protein
MSKTEDDRAQLFLNAGEETEDLLEFITRQLDDKELDELHFERIHPDQSLASEPITIAAVCTLSATVAYSVTRLLEKWLETRRQREVRRDLLIFWEKDPALGKKLCDLERVHSSVVVKQGMPDIRMVTSMQKVRN